MNTGNNNIALTVIAICVVIATGFYLYDRSHSEPKTMGEKISNSIGEVTEEIKDEIDDNTTSKQ